MTNSAHRYPQTSPDRTSIDRSIPASWWQRKSVRFKTTILAIAIGTIPTLAVGSTAYYFAANSIEQETTSLRKTLVADLQNQVNVFMSDRQSDIEMMANLSIFTDPKLRELATAEEKSEALQKIQDAYDIYNSIAVFDAKGDFIAKTDGKSIGNHLNRGYIQAALKADGAVISQPRISTSSGIYSIYTASPIKDRLTGETIGFVRARIPVEVLKNLLQDYTTQGSQYYLLNGQNEIFLGSAGEYVIKTLSNESAVEDKTYNYEAIKANKIFPGTEILNSPDLAVDTALNTKTNMEQFITFAPAKATQGLPELNWQAIVATDKAIVFAPQRKLRLVFILGTAIVALGVGAIAYALAKRLLRPILSAAEAVREIGRGNFDTRLEIPGADEIARLGDDINLMAERLSNFVQLQTLLAQQSEAIKNITLRLATANDKSEILQIAVRQSYQTLRASRVVYYQFEDRSAGKVVAELAEIGAKPIQDIEFFDSSSIAEYFSRHQQDELQTEIIEDVEEANLAPHYRQQLDSLGVEASLTASVVVENKLDGLLIVHQCSNPRSWLNEEIEFVTQVASQIGFGVGRLKFLEQQRSAEAKEKAAKEAIQSRALSLLQEVSEVSEGNLTIRAKVTEDEIGTIADSYNSTIESLQKLVNQTKAAAIEVQTNTSDNNVAVQTLAQEAIAQSAEIARMLEQIKGMEQSINLVSTQSLRAEDFVKQANLTIDRSDKAMNQTVAEINAVQHTVTQTATKAQKLGESSLEISQAVNLISRFAAQTHLLALKASIEAARAGERGKGFAVIADEVRSLATQSAEATAEIETLVSKIQLETNEVVEAMNQGTEQIALGNELVQQTRQSLTQVSQVGNEISLLVGSITQAARQQSATSAQVSQTIVNVAAIAQNNSQSATQVSTSIEQLSAIAQKLQSNIGKFKT